MLRVFTGPSNFQVFFEAPASPIFTKLGSHGISAEYHPQPCEAGHLPLQTTLTHRWNAKTEFTVSFFSMFRFAELGSRHKLVSSRYIFYLTHRNCSLTRCLPRSRKSMDHVLLILRGVRVFIVFPNIQPWLQKARPGVGQLKQDLQNVIRDVFGRSLHAL